eukprot:TRINITY_DN4279_c3_g1_i1.p1 TRINITY_DN4279_c3_g1~~TRINITY_DN4279_c3_g1_i1.p1  ORF type:complete len:589 (+),score=163.72 TRINITY_DN4279_c3_g1_i1:23-1768(+)
MFDCGTLELIFTFCEAQSIREYGLVNKDWAVTSRSEAVWKELCMTRHGVVAKPANLSNWGEWYVTLQRGCASPNELLDVLKTQGVRITQMDQQYAAAMGTIKHMCEDRVKTSPVSCKGTRILQPASTTKHEEAEEEEERDGISRTSEGQVIFEEERATFVDAEYDEDFVVRRVSSSPTATAVLSPYRVKVERAGSEPSVPVNTPKKQWTAEPPVLATPPSESVETSTKHEIVTPPRQEPPRQMVQNPIRSASPINRNQDIVTNHLQYMSHPSAATPVVEQDEPMEYANDNDMSAYLSGVIQMQLEAEKSRLSSKLYLTVRQMLAENQSLRSMYNFQKSVNASTVKELQKEQKRNRELQAKDIAIASRLEESKRCVRKLKRSIASTKLATLPLHNELVTRMNMEQASREEVAEVRMQAERFLQQRDQLFTELQAGSAKVVALEEVIRDMEVQHEENLRDALTANANFSTSTPLETQNCALRLNLEGLQQVIQSTYQTNQELKQQMTRVVKAAESTASELQSVRTVHEQLLQQRAQEHQYWTKYEEKYIQQISTLHKTLQQQQQQISASVGVSSARGLGVSHP